MLDNNQNNNIVNDFSVNGDDYKEQNATDDSVIDATASFSEDKQTPSVENVVGNNDIPTQQPYVNYPAGYQLPNNYSQVNYTAVKQRESASSGVKFFAVLLAMVIVLTSGLSVGYLIGKNKNEIKTIEFRDTDLNLESKPLDSNPLSAAGVYDSVNKSVVGITIYNNSGISGTASGVVYTEDGFIITNDHIYSSVSSPKFKINTYDGKEYDAYFVAGDTRSDLAVLKIDANGFVPAVFGNPNELFVGEEVVAIGRPGGIPENSMTIGIISLKERRIQINTSYTMKLIQTDTALNPGNSGGALVNMYGQVVGITSSKIVADEYEGINFAIPSTTVKAVIESLIATGKVDFRTRLGITYREVSTIEAEVTKLPYSGIEISEISSDSDLYGKISVGDMIVAVNGNDIVSDDTILDVIDNSRPGDEIELTVFTTEGEMKNVKAKLLADTGTSSYKSELLEE